MADGPAQDASATGDDANSAFQSGVILRTWCSNRFFHGLSIECNVFLCDDIDGAVLQPGWRIIEHQMAIQGYDALIPLVLRLLAQQEVDSSLFKIPDVGSGEVVSDQDDILPVAGFEIFRHQRSPRVGDEYSGDIRISGERIIKAPEWFIRTGNICINRNYPYFFIPDTGFPGISSAESG